MANQPPFTHLEPAYQLHYYLCFKTHYLREALVDPDKQPLINQHFRSPAFSLAHCLVILNYHLVLVTDSRIPLFDECIAFRLHHHHWQEARFCD
jgi:hypothetical protein